MHVPKDMAFFAGILSRTCSGISNAYLEGPDLFYKQ